MSLPHSGAAPGLFSTHDPVKEVSPGQLLSNILDALKPDILRRSGPSKPLKPTAWLDGLRGWAAFSVVCLHLCVYTHPWIEHCYGTPMDREEAGQFVDTPATWPIIRLFFSAGHYAVMLFFTISGYVICIRLLQLLHEGRRAEFVEAVNSAFIRRPFRLVLPVLWSTLFLVFFWHITGIATPWPKRQPNLFWEIYAWLKETGKFMDIFRNGFLYHVYNVHSWTIPVELRGSFFLFGWLFAFHQVDNRTRIILQACFILFLSIGSPAAWYACFFAGMMTSELDMLSDPASPVKYSFPWDGVLLALRKRRALKMLLMHLMLLAGLYLGSQPSAAMGSHDDVLGHCVGWKTLNQLIPEVYYDDHGSFRWFWLFWAAWFTLLGVKEIPWVRGLFMMRFSQYLGKVSFALYLVHGPMIGLVGERLFYLTGVKKIDVWDSDTRAIWGAWENKWVDASWWPFTDNGYYGMEPNFLVAQAISVITSLYVAEIATKLIDAPSVKVARWVWGKVKRTKS